METRPGRAAAKVWAARRGGSSSSGLVSWPVTAGYEPGEPHGGVQIARIKGQHHGANATLSVKGAEQLDVPVLVAM